MFCPGISALEDGRILIQGGSDAKKNSFYNPATNEFTKAPDLLVARGYQSGATLSDGRVFTIGGAYSGPRKGKDGEVYCPKANAWKALLAPKPQLCLLPTARVFGERTTTLGCFPGRISQSSRPAQART